MVYFTEGFGGCRYSRERNGCHSQGGRRFRKARPHKRRPKVGDPVQFLGWLLPSLSDSMRCNYGKAAGWRCIEFILISFEIPSRGWFDGDGNWISSFKQTVQFEIFQVDLKLQVEILDIIYH